MQNQKHLCRPRKKHLHASKQAFQWTWCEKRWKDVGKFQTAFCSQISGRTRQCFKSYLNARLNIKMYICTHARTPGTTARQRTREEPLQTQEALHIFFVRCNQTTFRTSNARTSLYPLPETPIPLHPPSSLLNIPQNSSRTAGKRSVTVLN